MRHLIPPGDFLRSSVQSGSACMILSAIRGLRLWQRATE
jgi:hypothetical protein